MILPLVIYPDPRLMQKSLPVQVFDEQLHQLLDNMFETMSANNGIGLAAVQVAVLKQVLIVNCPIIEIEEDGQKDPQASNQGTKATESNEVAIENSQDSKANLIEIINPKIVDKNGKITYKEGCLSIPEYFDEVDRFAKLSISYQNRFGEILELEAEGILSVVLQHEIDHTQGRLFIDKLPILKRKKFDKLWKKKQ